MKNQETTYYQIYLGILRVCRQRNFNSSIYNNALDDRHTSFLFYPPQKFFLAGIFSKEKKNRTQRYKFFPSIKKSTTNGQRNFSNLSPVGNKSSKIESIFFSYNRNIHFATHCALIYARQRAIRFKKEKRIQTKSNIIVRIETQKHPQDKSSCNNHLS